VIVALLSYLFINKKLSTNIFIIAIIFITMIDLWRISYRAMDLEDKKIEQQPFLQTDIINFIKSEQQQTGERYRICDLSHQVVNSNTYFFIENTNGYHPAKLRTFQDMMDAMCGGSTSNVTHPFL
jgi:predicted metalloprotease